VRLDDLVALTADIYSCSIILVADAVANMDNSVDKVKLAVRTGSMEESYLPLISSEDDSKTVEVDFGAVVADQENLILLSSYFLFRRINKEGANRAAVNN
jgi:hypothetical protein